MTENAPEAPERERSDRPIPSEPRVWPVFAAWVMAFVTIVILSILAAALVASLYPDVAPSELLRNYLASWQALAPLRWVSSLPFSSSIAHSTPPPSVASGPETGRDLVLMILGMLALGQTLDSLTTLVGLGRRGALWDARQTLMGVAGADLFAAVLVIGLLRDRPRSYSSGASCRRACAHGGRPSGPGWPRASASGSCTSSGSTHCSRSS